MGLSNSKLLYHAQAVFPNPNGRAGPWYQGENKV